MYEITNPKFYHDIYNIISKYHFDLNKLGFEITETVEAKDFDIINDTLQRFRNLGIKIYLDDFGTGYSNIEHITKIPIDIIKFDRSLVISSGQSEKSKYIVSNMSDIFYNTNYNILYEGMKDFCLRVSNEANNIDGKIINISYPSEDLAIIVYKNKIKE